MRYNSGMPTIRQLPPQLVNQIAAGEVIERPSSVVKELVENSIDAGSRRIEVTIAGGGSELIRVSDDGCGMTEEQLPLAIASHATSKLPDEQSLFNIATLGFRGEAMASIASVSQLTIRSRTEGAPAGAEIVVRGGAVEPTAPCGCPVGTVVEVRNLFFNTPVRRKFMRSAQTETGHIVEAFTRLALANPQIHFVLRGAERVMHDLPQTTNWSERIAAFFGVEIGGSLIRIDGGDEEVRVSGYVCEPSVSRGNTRMQYLFLNGRHIRDRALQHALDEAYRGLLMVGRHPVCFLRLDMPPEMVDVNVHPTKLEVRFTDSGRIYARLLQTLRHHFLKTDMTARVGVSGREETYADAQPVGPAAQVGLGAGPDWVTPAESLHRQRVIDWARTGQSVEVGRTSTARLPGVSPELRTGGVPEFRPFPGGPMPWEIGPAARPQMDHDHREVVTSGTVTSGTVTSGTGPDVGVMPEAGVMGDDAMAASPGDAQDALSGEGVLGGSGEASGGTGQAPSHSYLGIQIHNRYLVTQDECGMVVIDQHALHERVMYERIRAKVIDGGGRLETQRLLVPEPVSLTPAERSAVLDARECLGRVGIEIDDFGGDTILISGYPTMLAKSAPGEVLRQALESILGFGRDPEPRDLLDHLLHSMACKAAVKAGDRLTSEEITALLEQRHLYQDTHHCPHGRPTALFFSRDELDKMFGRLGPQANKSFSGQKRPS